MVKGSGAHSSNYIPYFAGDICEDGITTTSTRFKNDSFDDCEIFILGHFYLS
jgi:hypothetical protein